MNNKKAFGFTIVETMLFLGITGLLVVGIMVGTGSSINNQRYKDSVNSLQSYFQKFFSEAVNVSNDGNSSSYSCSPSADVSVGGATSRGQSDCVILGKLIRTVTVGPDTKQLSISTVIGVPPVTPPAATDDISILNSYTIKIVQPTIAGFTSSYDVEWNGKLNKLGGAASQFSILLIKSPVNNITRAYTYPYSVTDTNFKSLMINADNLKAANTVKMCVDSDGLYSGEKMVVVVNAGATSAAGIEVFSNTAYKALPGVTVGC